ncbi:MAG: DsbA family protein [Armatimonadetes bacterium]|nr:DsbA family protein [Armatimonadota bacterium]
MSIPSDTLTPRRKQNNGDTKFMIIALLVILLGGGSLFFLNRLTTPPDPTSADIPSPDPATPAITAEKVDELFTKARHQKGAIAGADLTIVEFADFECPSCRIAYDQTLKTWDAKLPSHRMAFYQFPLPMHPRAVPAVVASEAAAKQGKFWEIYAVLFDKDSEGLDDAKIVAAAKKAGLDMTRFDADIKNGAPFKALTDADTKAGAANGVDSTPTFFFRDKSGSVAVLSGSINLGRLLPDLKDGVIGNDAIKPADPARGQPFTVYINGKKESR